MVDDHPIEKKAMAMFRNGQGKEATKVQDEFLELIKSSGVDHCTCPSGCKFHGKCVECVIVHRGHGDHLPHCFRDMVNRRLKGISELSEHSFDPKAEE